MGSGISNATDTHNCSDPHLYNSTNITAAPLSDEEIGHMEWIAEYGWIVAVLLALAGCTINNLGSNIQKLSFRFGDEKNRNARCIGVWASGFVMQIFGAVLDLVALKYGDQSLVAPIAALALVANIGFARCIHGEDLSCLDGLFMCVIFIGCVVCTISAGKHSCPISRAEIWVRLSSFEYFWGYAIIIAVIMGVLGILQGLAERFEKKHGPDSPEYLRLAKVHRVGYPIMGGVIGAQGVLLGNMGVTLFSEAFEGTGGEWQAWEVVLFILFGLICLLFIFLQVAFLNKGLARWDAMLEVPIMQSLWIVFCIIGGGVFFEEFGSFEFWQFFVFPLGVCITILGVALLAYYRRKKEKKEKTAVVPTTVAEDVEDGKHDPLISGTKTSPQSKDNHKQETKQAPVIAEQAPKSQPKESEVCMSTHDDAYLCVLVSNDLFVLNLVAFFCLQMVDVVGVPVDGPTDPKAETKKEAAAAQEQTPEPVQESKVAAAAPARAPAPAPAPSLDRKKPAKIQVGTPENNTRKEFMPSTPSAIDVSLSPANKSKKHDKRKTVLEAKIKHRSNSKKKKKKKKKRDQTNQAPTAT